MIDIKTRIYNALNDTLFSDLSMLGHYARSIQHDLWRMQGKDPLVEESK